MTHSAQANSSIIRKVWNLLTHSERRRAVLLLAMMILGMALEVLGVGFAIPAVAILTQPNYVAKVPALQKAVVALGNPDRTAIVVGGMLILVGVFVVKTVFIGILTWRQTQFAFDVQSSLSQRLFKRYLQQPYTFHLQRNSATLIRNCVSEVQQFTGHAMIPGMQLMTEGLVLIGLFALLFVVAPLGALIVVGALGSVAWASHHFTRTRILRWGKERMHHDALSFQHLQQGLGGVKDVKLMGREADFLELYRRSIARSARVGHLHKTLQQFPRLGLELLAIMGLAVLVITLVAQGKPMETLLPTLGVFVAAAFRTLPSVNRVISAIHSVRYGRPVVDTLSAELQIAEPAAESAGAPVSPLRDLLEVDGIDYAYPGAASRALKSLTLSVRRGESVGFIGPSGSGKTTLVDILLGLLKPDAGQVSLDGADIQRNLRGWQNQLGYVPQSIFLTDDTLRRNIAFGLPREQIDDAAVLRAIRAAQLEAFVAQLPNGVDTVVGERGIRLSGGQRQRIGIARALYHDPAVLVLDEATSSLDTPTERGVMQAVQALHGAKTIIIVAHRLSTVEYCDRLYRLEAGTIVQQGTPESVLASIPGG